MNLATKIAVGSLLLASAIKSKEKDPKCFIYRDDIGAFWGIKGY